MVVGLDGASPDLIYPWAKEGKLPTFQKLIEVGTHGDLASTVPAHSGPAWVSAMTGKNPGKHGVFYFTTLDPREKPRIVSSLDIKSPTVYDILGMQGRASILVNIPLTYPPKRVNGIMVAGYFAPSTDSEYTYPHEIGSDLAKIGYELEFSIKDARHEVMADRSPEETLEEASRKRSEYFTRVYTVEKKVRDAFIALTSRYPWDFAMVVFTSLDRLQHALWRPLNEPTVEISPPYSCSEYVLHAYQETDGLVRSILESVGKENSFIVMSDHGFGPVPRTFYINRWLKSMGLLKPKAKGIKRALKLIAPQGLRRRLSGGQTNEKLEEVGLGDVGGLIDPAILDYKSTKAYCSAAYGFLNITADKTSQDFARIRSYLLAELTSLKDPLTGSGVINAAYRKEDLYNGPYVDLCPDIVIETKRLYKLKIDTRGSEIFRDTNEKPASHYPNGIIFLTGQEFRESSRVEGANIVDLTPTLLHMLGVALPSDLDGKVLKSAFKPSSDSFSREVAFSREEGEGRRVRGLVEDLKRIGKI